MIIKTEKQKDNVVKYFYDVSKIFLAVMVITPVVQWQNFKLWVFLFGCSATLFSFIFAFILDGKEVKQ